MKPAANVLLSGRAVKLGAQLSTVQFHGYRSAVLLAASVALAIAGGGALAVDNVLFRRDAAQPASSPIPRAA